MVTNEEELLAVLYKHARIWHYMQGGKIDFSHYEDIVMDAIVKALSNAKGDWYGYAIAWARWELKNAAVIYARQRVIKDNNGKNAKMSHLWLRMRYGVEQPHHFHDTHTVRRALCLLKPRYRILLEELFYQDISVRELARRWGRDHSTIREMKSRVLAKLRDTLTDRRQSHE